MKFGIFYEHQLPRPWSRESEYRLLHESLAQIELADGLGYDYAWEVEHHFLIPKPYQKPHPPLWVACSNIRWPPRRPLPPPGAVPARAATRRRRRD